MSGALSEAERRRLHETFETLCRIESPTLSERACADWIIAELGAMGLEVSEDDAGRALGSDTGNLLARIPAAAAPAAAREPADPSPGRSRDEAGGILLCSHMDTVPLAAPVDPVQRDGAWVNANPGILGADNKAAVAAMVEVARILTSRGGGAVAVELLFTVAEETGLNGAKEFDTTLLQSRYGYTLDHASPLGEIITASPTYMRINAEIRGQAAHAGLEPERGVNAVVAAANAIVKMPQGRIDAETTANVGSVAGGSATNVVPDRCVLEAEVRSISQARVDELVTLAVDAIQDAADSAGCDVDIALQKMFTGYRLREREESVQVAQRALRAIGYEPSFVTTGGGADANALRVRGFPCTNLANGTERAHQRTESVSNSALDGNLALLLALIEEAAV